MGQPIRVETPELAVAAHAIGSASAEAEAARAAVDAAQGQAGAFGGEPIGQAFLTLCAHAGQAADAYASTGRQLAENTAAASLGYLTTDQGVVPMTRLPGFKA